ncbi:hypothetical protein BT96DRAFT_1038196 [Gymnopus androsaceus JB14]|uniref:Uncharacterized protein n=1 Tax=Gymnopus androsaceus JB14 TaxID=1447944 RepID=A0A6A4HJF4_9AGAR|nr:hypothetical protein BT96DRAFT_1038196 [Gymnopus androsaceus JB14]
MSKRRINFFGPQIEGKTLQSLDEMPLFSMAMLVKFIILIYVHIRVKLVTVSWKIDIILENNGNPFHDGLYFVFNIDVEHYGLKIWLFTLAAFQGYMSNLVCQRQSSLPFQEVLRDTKVQNGSLNTALPEDGALRLRVISKTCILHLNFDSSLWELWPAPATPLVSWSAGALETLSSTCNNWMNHTYFADGLLPNMLDGGTYPVLAKFHPIKGSMAVFRDSLSYDREKLDVAYMDSIMGQQGMSGMAVLEIVLEDENPTEAMQWYRRAFKHCARLGLEVVF